MARVFFFLPYKELLAPAEELAGRFSGFSELKIVTAETGQVAEMAREAEKDGYEIIIARGAQAQIVKRTVTLPVVEFKASTQSIGMAIRDLRRALGSDRPVIGLVALTNTLPYTTHYRELFGVELKVYPAKELMELRPLVDKAAEEGCQAVIGANTVLARAGELGLPCGFLGSGEEGLLVAFEAAGRVAYALEEEKKRRAEMDFMLNNTTGGIMQIDPDGVITRVNGVGSRILAQPEAELTGRPVTEVFPEITRASVAEFFSRGEDMHAYVVDRKTRTLLVNAVLIRVEDALQGMILTFQEEAMIRQMDSDLRYELVRRGFLARHSFDRFVAAEKSSGAMVRSARRMAAQEAPVMLTGTDYACLDILAECIHNESPFRSNAFITVDCSAYHEEDLDNMLFGNYTSRKDTPQSLAELAENGSLYLKNIHALPLQIQYKVAQLARGQFLHNGANIPVQLRVRLIASTSVSLVSLMEAGQFRSDLYYALHVLKLDVPPLRERKADIPGWFEHYFSEWEDTLRRRFHLTQDARDLAAGYDWPGGLFQMNCVCERLVLLSEKRSIGPDFLRAQIDQVLPPTLPDTDRVVVYRDPKAVEVARLLREHNGSREKVAKALGVSKTTLWRYIKKYGIGPDYSY